MKKKNVNNLPIITAEDLEVKQDDITAQSINNSLQQTIKTHVIFPINKTNEKWESFVANERFTLSFIIRSIIALVIYWSVSFSDFFVQEFWVNMVLGPLYRTLGFANWFTSIAAGDEKLLLEYINMFLQNGLYFILFIIIVPLFIPELVDGFKKTMKSWWLILLTPVFHIATIFSSAFIQIAASLFVTLPDISQNQQMIEESMSVSIAGNVFPVIIAAPIVEEIVFRAVIAGLLYMIIMTILKKTKLSAKSKYIFSAIFGIITSAVAFGLLHVVGEGKGDYLAMIPYVVMGIAFTTIYFATKKNLLIAIILHMYNNAFSIITFSLLGIIHF